MARRHHAPVLTTALVLGVGLTGLLTACSDGSAPTPSASSSSSADASQSTGSTPGGDQTGPGDDGTASGTGNGSGVEDPGTIDWAAVSQQGIAGAGGGSVVSLSGSGDSWTVVVVGPDGSETQSVVSAALGRVTSGPFPKSVDTATGTADLARATAAKTDAATAATTALQTVSGSKLSALTLGGTAAAPVWTASVVAGGATTTVTIDGLTGAATAS